MMGLTWSAQLHAIRKQFPITILTCICLISAKNPAIEINGKNILHVKKYVYLYARQAHLVMYSAYSNILRKIA